MGMISNLLRVSQEELNSYIQDSSLFEDRIYKDYDENDIDDALVDLDKSWDAIAFLFGNNADDYLEHPLATAIFGSHTLDENQDIGYGPARFVTTVQVKEINELLSQLSDEELRKRFSPQRLEEEEIYPSFWTEVDEDELWEYLSENIHTIREIYSTAAKNNEAVITFIN
ncbi:MAG: YfbM family protein [Flavobacteriaceae bacterium]|jgi:hypothetical protein|nr:YfbM family protein [Flavobacteriaceae bacterium]